MISHDEITRMLALEDPEELKALQKRATDVMLEQVGSLVYYRGIIEWSNICSLNCYYCGIRKGNPAVHRYTLEKQGALDAAQWCAKQGYGSIVIQAGERQDSTFTEQITEIVRQIKEESRSDKLPNGLGITLSLGEQTREVYEDWFVAGAHRYLLRIESTSPTLFSTLHPTNQSFDKRLQALADLKASGYQVGTGVMIGLPGQTISMLADDIQFFKDQDIDMVGMGPFIPHAQTPFSAETLGQSLLPERKRFQLALNMIAATRLCCPDINIASTTALQALVPDGREQGLTYGANVTMPNLTPQNVRKDYTLYDGKPCLDESRTECKSCLLRRVQSTGREVGFDQWGDSIHFKRRTE